MTPTDTKSETPRCPRIAAIGTKFLNTEPSSREIAELYREGHQLELELTQTKALLERAMNWVESMSYDDGGEGTQLHCIGCGTRKGEDHDPECSVKNIFDSYAALTNGKEGE